MTASAPDSHPRPRILLAEDDARLAGAYARRLGAEYLAVDVVGSVSDARAQERRCSYACLVLDRLLPDGDIIELVREIDDRPGHPPIVLVSAVADQEDRVAGLQAGADDYVAKPVHLDELAVRVIRLLGAAPTPEGVPPGPIELGEVTLDPDRLRVRVGDEPLLLPGPQVLILRALMTRPGHAVRAEELLDACAGWDGGTAMNVSTLAVHIDALGQALDGHLAIERAPRHGYRVRVGSEVVVVDRRRRLIRRHSRRPRPS